MEDAPEDLDVLAKSAQEAAGGAWRASKWGARLTRGGVVTIWDDVLRIHDGTKDHSVPYLDIEKVAPRKGLFWSAIALSISGEKVPTVLRGFKHGDAARAVRAIDQVRTHANVLALKKLAPAADDIHKQIQNIVDRSAWITRSQAEHLAAHVRKMASQSISGFPANARGCGALDYFSAADSESLSLVVNASSVIPALIEAHNTSFLKRELVSKKSFFDEIEKNPLTQEQRIASITFDDNVMAIAAAGSGKTSTLVAKAGYAIIAGIAEPQEILLLAFNSDAAKELKERVEERLGPGIPGASDIAVSTFHAFGLRVIGEATGKKPRVAPWVDHGKEIEMLGEIVTDLRQQRIFDKDWMLFRTVYARALPQIGEKEEPEWWDRASGSFGFQTMRGQTVKSKEELMIANWLAINGVEYCYERPYQFDTATATHSQYHPDFYYPSADLYHEHFALNKNGWAPAKFPGYAEEAAWKRKVHEDAETNFIETTSYGIRRPDGFDKLESALREHGVAFDAAAVPDIAAASPEEERSLLGFMRTFLAHVKSNRLTQDDLSRRSEDGWAGARAHAGREAVFLRIFGKIWSEWDRRLSESGYVDFEDMLVKATDYLASDSYLSPYKIVMADEFQDSSIVRGHMLRELTKPRGRRLFVVGDDWQAIYRFAGADISLMYDFEHHFGPCDIVPLTMTFRCPQQISDVAADFVSKNAAQIPKDVTTANPRTENSILCFSANDERGVSGLLAEQLQEIYEQGMIDAPAKKQSVMILGRYRSDRPRNLGKWRSQFSDRLDIAFATAHRAKGLEADYVLVVNLTKGRMGFPSEIEDDPLLLLAMPSGEEFRFAEERRLFYVALTRAKKNVVLYTVKGRESEFLTELQSDGKLKIQRQDGAEDVEACPECRKGVLISRHGKFGEFLGCSRFPRCRYTRNLRHRATS